MNLPVKRDIGPRDEITLFLILDMRVRNEMNRALGHLCAHIG